MSGGHVLQGHHCHHRLSLGGTWLLGVHHRSGLLMLLLFPQPWEPAFPIFSPLKPRCHRAPLPLHCGKAH